MHGILHVFFFLASLEFAYMISGSNAISFFNIDSNDVHGYKI